MGTSPAADRRAPKPRRRPGTESQDAKQAFQELTARAVARHATHGHRASILYEQPEHSDETKDQDDCKQYPHHLTPTVSSNGALRVKLAGGTTD